MAGEGRPVDLWATAAGAARAECLASDRFATVTVSHPESPRLGQNPDILGTLAHHSMCTGWIRMEDRASTGALKGSCSIRINDQWRIVFEWTRQGPSQVRIADYH